MLRRHFLTGLALALKQDRLDAAASIVENAAARGYFAAAALHVRQGASEFSRAFGKAKPETPFLLASISKPMTATAVMILSDRKALDIGDPVRKHIPEFTGGGRDAITIRHCLTHTSGLPDMLPENEALRRRHAPLKEFVAATCQTPLLFPPGERVRYQSMGVLLAGEIVERVAKSPLPEFLRKEVYGPLKMASASLGLGGRAIPSTAQCQVSGDDDWNWNSPYWRNLASPWGGAHASAADVGRFLRAFLKPAAPILKPQTAALMTTPQNSDYGIGWRIKPGGFGPGCSARTFGHSGSTGTMSWADPERDLTFVLLTTRPAAEDGEKLVGAVSAAVSEAG